MGLDDAESVLLFSPHISLLQEFMFLDSSGSSACDFIFLVCFVEVEDNKKRHLDV